MSTYKKILVAMDGSPQSEKAFDEAIEIAKRNEAAVILTSIINDAELTSSAFAFSRLLNDEKEHVRELMEERVKRMKVAGVENVTTITEIGSPKIKIATEIPRDEGIDLIVMGSTGKGAITQALMGSTTSYVVNHAPCNVMVIK